MQFACCDVTISYEQHPAIHHLTCQFKIGDKTAIVGPNGAGKSTLVKALIGEVKPDSGKIIKQNIVNSDIAYLPQINSIDDSIALTVEDVLLLGLWYKIGLFKKVDKSAIDLVNYSLNEVGLSGFNSRFINQLSRGQMQRVFMARIIMQQAKIIILDEPFNAIDSKTTDDLLILINNWHREGKTIIAVLHDLGQVARFFDYTLLIAQELITYDKTELVLKKDIIQKAYSSSFVWLDDDLCVTNP